MDNTDFATLKRTEANRISDPQYYPLGEQVIIIQFEKIMSREINRRIIGLAELVHSSAILGITQVIPTFCSLAVRYDSLVLSYREIKEELQKLYETMYLVNDTVINAEKTVYIPVVYGGEYGPDLEYVAKETGIGKEDVIRLHSSNPYYIYMLGVIASFPYCGDLDSRLALKRRTSPRIRVEKGSIAIANQQTIILPLASPSGWHMIGRTPMETFNPSQSPPSSFLAGDYIKFEPITVKEAEDWNDYKQSEWNEKWNL